MIVRMEFTLPEDKDALTLAKNGGDYHACLWEIDQHLRGLLKHGFSAHYSAAQLADDIRDMIHDSVNLGEVE